MLCFFFSLPLSLFLSLSRYNTNIKWNKYIFSRFLRFKLLSHLFVYYCCCSWRLFFFVYAIFFRLWFASNYGWNKLPKLIMECAGIWSCSWMICICHCLCAIKIIYRPTEWIWIDSDFFFVPGSKTCSIFRCVFV